MLMLLTACVLVRDSGAPAVGDDTSGATDTSENTDTTDTSETGGTSETGATDTGDQAHTHYMTTVTGTTTLSGGTGSPCQGEAHLNVYDADGWLFGYGSCSTDDDAELLAGNFNGNVVDSVLTGTWSADNGGGVMDLSVIGTVDGATLHADLVGDADWASFVGVADGEAL